MSVVRRDTVTRTNRQISMKEHVSSLQGYDHKNIAANNDERFIGVVFVLLSFCAHIHIDKENEK